MLLFLSAILLCTTSTGAADDLSEAAARQASQSQLRLLSNLSDSSVRPGAVIASPSRSEPDYFFHWVRDAALVMENYTAEYSGKIASERLQSWLEFETHLQDNSQSASLGEPKFHVDGSVFTGPWGRPQNDGPALRALTMMSWAQHLLSGGNRQFVLEKLAPPIARDLHYTMATWRDSSFDLWEEVRGQHFFTRMAQARALQRGSQFFLALGYWETASELQQAAAAAEASLQEFWSEKEALLRPTLYPSEGPYKPSHLDLAILLASLYLTRSEEAFGITDARILASVQKWKDSFSFYEINRTSSVPLAGRYPEDVYDGVGFNGGHPWFIANTALAQANCRLLQFSRVSGRFRVSAHARLFFQDLLHGPYWLKGEYHYGEPVFRKMTDELERRARQYFAEVLYHAGRDGQMDEQFSRFNGYMRGARDLSWSHAAYLRAYRECKAVLGW